MNEFVIKRRQRAKAGFTPDPAQMALFPAVSGNSINGLGERMTRPPSPIYWHDPAILAHGDLQNYFYENNDFDELRPLRAERDRILAKEPRPIGKNRAERSPDEWSEFVKREAIAATADLVGIARVNPDWVFEGYAADYDWIIMLGVAMDYGELQTAPEMPSIVEVIRQYMHGQKVANGLADVIRGEGFDAHPHCGPMAGAVNMVPAALKAGLGELGKHGSIINREYGSSFRLAYVLTSLPLAPDEPDGFGADDFCATCHACVDACPPDAIFKTKQWVRGAKKWFVDFDECLPYFNQNGGCGICLAACPWSMPGVPNRLIAKMAERNARRAPVKSD